MIALSRRRIAWSTGVAAIAIALVVLGAFLYARGGGPVPHWFPFRASLGDPLASSSPAETALRTVRLAGFERAVVGESDGIAVVRLEMQQVSSAADVEIAWQTGFGALVTSYSGADRYVVQVFDGARPLVEVGGDGAAVRRAVDDDDGDALRAAVEFVFLSEEGSDG